MTEKDYDKRFYVLDETKTMPLHTKGRSLKDAQSLKAHMRDGGFDAHICTMKNGFLETVGTGERIFVSKLERGAMTEEAFKDFCLDVRFNATIQEQQQGIDMTRAAELQEIVEANGLDDVAPQQPRQATDLEKAEVIASDLAAFRDSEGLTGAANTVVARHEAAAIFCRAADTIDEAAHHVRGAKGTYDERTDYALNVVAKRPEVIEAHRVVTTLAPHLDTHYLHNHLARTDPENGHRRGEAAEGCLAPYAGAEPETPHHDRITHLKQAVDSGREELTTRYGVREPANALDVARAGTEAQDFAEREVYPAEAGLQLSAAAADARSIEQEAHNLVRHRLCKDLEGHTSGQEMADTLKQVHAVEVEHAKAAEKTYTRQQLQALADKCDPAPFAPSTYDGYDLGSMEHEHEMLHTYGLSADEAHERAGKQGLAKLVDAAERNQTANKQAQNIAAQRGHGHGFSR